MTRQPRYLDLAANLRRQIAKGRYAIGDLLPTEHALCEKHDVSRHTTRAALQVLEDQGLIERRPGLGTRVIASGAAPVFTQPLGGLEDLMQYAHEARLAITSSSKTTLASRDATRLGAKQSSKWLRIDGVRRVHGRPVAATSIFIAEAIGARLSDFRDSDHAVTEHIEQKYGISAATINQRISAELLTRADASLLEDKVGSPILRTIRRYFDAAERLFVISDSRHPAEIFSYEMSFRRASVK